MNVTAIAMVRDEEDIVRDTVRRMARQVDHVIVADNRSRDGTRSILETIPRVEVVDDPEPGYYQSHKMSQLAARAREAGADWVIPFDADEVWLAAERYLNHSQPLKAALELLDPAVLCVEAPLLDHVASPYEGSTPIERMPWRRAEQLPLRKVACRALPGLTIMPGNHAAQFRGVRHPPTVTNILQVRHFPYRSVEQFIRKARNGAEAYRATNLPEEIGAHWRGYDRLDDAQLEQVFRDWFSSDDPQAEGLIFDPV